MKTSLSWLLWGALALAFLAPCCAAATAQQRDRSAMTVSQYPLVGDDGRRVPNHSAKLPVDADRLPGAVTVGNPRGTVTLVEFYDPNCPFCRIASVDIDDLVDTDADLKLVLVPYPILGPASVAASHIELAVEQMGTPRQFYDFHLKIYAQRGTTDGLRALELARELGFDGRALVAIADSDDTTRTITNLVALGRSLGLAATPSFIVEGVAILGYPGRHALQSIVDAAHTCGRVVC